MKKLSLLILAALCCSLTFAAKQPAIDVQHFEPAFWWTGMHQKQVQLLLHGNNISASSISVDYPGVTINEINKVENPNYLFVYLTVSDEAQPGTVVFTLQQGKKKMKKEWKLLERNKKVGAQGFDSHDVMYLITPDRFSDGDQTNNFPEARVNRKSPWARHGGDIRGVINHLDYLQDLGLTAIWLNPVVKNSPRCYHGYAINDFYTIDPCYGTMDEYIEFIDKAHDKGMKVVMDMIFNHSGGDHWWMKDLPSKDWYNNNSEYIGCNHNKWTVMDPYAAPSDRKGFTNGWFTPDMPDLNQQNRFVHDYLIQNSIWWIEYTRIDGIRQDTHPYADYQFMSDWCKAVNDEYPEFNITGETWYPVGPGFTAWWQKDSKLSKSQSNLKTSMDFNLMFVCQDAFDKRSHYDEQHSTGIFKLYEALSQDFLYENPNSLLVFLDNHDVSRFNHEGDGGVTKFKQGMTFLLTTRGIPQIYYGCELLMHGPKSEGDGSIRKDFPGGWPGDERDAFTKEGRTAEENEAHDYLQALLKWRKTCPAVSEGSLMHYAPGYDGGCYVYTRTLGEQIIMVVLSGTDNEQILDVKYYQDAMKGRTRAIDCLTGEEYDFSKNIVVPGRGTVLVELK